VACRDVCVNAATFAVSVVCYCIHVLTGVDKLRLLRWLRLKISVAWAQNVSMENNNLINVLGLGPCASRLHPSRLQSSEAEYACCTDMGVFSYARKCTVCVRIFGIFETPFVIKSSLSEELVARQVISSVSCL
jgi:hypothetical protein